MSGRYELRNRIVEELSRYVSPIRYSEFREKFDDPNFVDDLIFLITTEDVRILDWREGENKYPEEVEKINKVAKQIYGPNIYAIEPVGKDKNLGSRHEPLLMTKFNLRLWTA